MERETLEVLIATMGRDDLEFVRDMNLQTDFVVGNQNGENGRTEQIIDGHRCLLLNSNQKGLSKNRNLTLSNAAADICLFADDDITYVDNYEEIVLSAFEKNKDADVILFNLYEDPIVRYVIKETHRVRGIEFFKYGSVRIAVRRKSVMGKVSFDESFGAGGKIPIGEDTIYLGDCLKKGLRIVAVPDYIVKLRPSESTWFFGYTDDYFINKGKMFFRIFGSLYLPIAIQDAYRHKKLYGADKRWTTYVRLMAKGAREAKTHQSRA